MKIKIFYVTLIITLFCSVVLVSAEDVERYEYSKQLVDTVVGETVFDMEPETTVSRSEFIKKIVKLFNILPSERKLSFKDIDPNNEYQGELAAAVDLGLVEEADTFRPDDAITYNEALKIAVVAIGMEDDANLSGGYPYGYIEVAGRAKLSSNMGTVMTVKNCYILFENLLNSKPYRYMFENGVFVRRNNSTETIMNLVYNLYTYEGVVTRTRYSSLFDAQGNIQSDVLEINGMGFIYPEQTGNELGKNCLVLYEGGNNETIKYCFERKNTEFTVMARDIIEISNSALRFQRIDENENSVRVDGNIPVVYNGQYAAEPLVNFTDANGYITLIDNNKDGLYDVAFVSDYEYIRIESIDIALERIASYGGKYSFDFKNFEGVLKMTDVEGNDIGMESLNIDDVCAVQCSKDMFLVKIITLGRGVFGEIESIDGEESLTFNGEKYWISEFCKKNCFAELRPGNSATAYMGLVNDIAYIAGSTDYVYGVLVRAQVDIEGEEILWFKIFDASGKMQTIKVRKEPIVDGKRTKYNDVAFVVKYSEAVGSLIRFKTDKNSEIAYIDFSEIGTNYSREKDDNNSLTEYTFPAAQEIGNFYYRSVSKSCQPYFSLDEAVVFMIPKDKAAYEDYAAGTYSLLGSKKTLRQSDVRVYDMDEYLHAGAIVLSNVDNSTSQSGDTTYVVEKVEIGINDDDVLGRWISCWTSGKFYRFFVPNDVKITNSLGADICAGDIVRLAIGANNEIVRAEVDYDVSTGVVRRAVPTDSNVHFGDAKTRQDYDIVYNDGSAYSFKGSYITLSRTSDGGGGYLYESENLNQYLLTTTNVVRYNLSTKTLIPAKANGIKTYLSNNGDADYVVLKQNAYNTNMVVIYEKE